MTTYSDVAPPDRADTTPLDTALRVLLAALSSTLCPKPTVTLRLGKDEWDKARTYYQRPYRGRPSEFGVYLGCGTVWVEPADAEERRAVSTTDGGPTRAQMAEGYVSQRCAHCSVTTTGFRLAWCVACGKGYDVPVPVPCPRCGDAACDPLDCDDPPTTTPSDAQWPAVVARTSGACKHERTWINQQGTGCLECGAMVVETANPASPIIVPPLAPIDRDAVDARSAEVALATLGSTNAQPADSLVEYGGPWKGDGT